MKQESDSDSTAYSGTTLSFGYAATSGQEAHQEIVDKLRSAKIVEARYNPENPAESCLAYGVSRSHYILMVFALTWMLFVIGLFTVVFLIGQSDSRLLNGIVIIEKEG